MTQATLFLTGATGFLGGMTLSRLLPMRAGHRILVLIRAANNQDATQRLRRSLARFIDASRLEAEVSALEIVRGDLNSPETLDDSRLDEVTHAFHLAANTSFRSTNAVRQTNVAGTLALARRFQRASPLKRFLHVSTAYLCGAGAPRVIHEDDFPRPDGRHFVEYSRSKAEAELLLARAAPELPLVVARPSAVVGHTRLGCRPSASLFWYYRALFLLRRIPFGPAARRDIVPVDYVADALLVFLFQSDLRHRCYHISAGEASAAPWFEIAAAFARCYGDHCAEDFQQTDLEAIEREWDTLADRLGPGDKGRMLAALRLIWPISGSGVEVFDNQRLLTEGLPPPPPFPSYLERCAALPAGRSVFQQMVDDE
jgi:nucleoside-diphosphate-sugar epimerase